MKLIQDAFLIASIVATLLMAGCTRARRVMGTDRPAARVTIQPQRGALRASHD